MTFDELTFGGPYRIAQIRYVKDDGEFHRETRRPGADLSDLPKDAQAAISAEWTQEVLRAYEARPQPVFIPPAPEAKIAALEARIAKLESGSRESLK